MSKIEWTERTWNPIVGCSVVSPGCTNCYAMKMAARIEAMDESAFYGKVDAAIEHADDLDHENRIRAEMNNRRVPSHYAGTTKTVNGNPVWTGKLAQAPDHILTEPLRRRKPTMWFVNSMSDLFHEDIPDAWIDRVFAVMALCPQHTFHVLTKRSRRMRDYMAGPWPARVMMKLNPFVTSVALGDIAGHHASPKLNTGTPLPNVWLGVSAEDQKRADDRVPDLLATPAAIRFVSAEPLLGPIDFTKIGDVTFRLDALTGKAEHLLGYTGQVAALDWVIVGGESGPGAREFRADWARNIIAECQHAGVPVFMKQMGSRPVYGTSPARLKHSKGADPAEWPIDMRVRQTPAQRPTPTNEAA